MSANGQAPIIIKKVKKGGGDGHHGGAWKVAYADFVTAMMAFFLLMWLLNATTEKQRKGIADYFSPTIPINRVSGGGSGSFGGDSIFSEETLAQSGNGGLPRNPTEKRAGESSGRSEVDDSVHDSKEIEKIEELLSGKSGESMVSEATRRHILTRVTDEGLLIELFDIEGDPLFEPGTGTPTPVMQELAGVMARIFRLVENEIAIGGHVRAQPVVVAKNTAWDLSGDRATAMRELLEAQQVETGRVQRVTGYADRKPAARNPMALRNNRVELTLLRKKTP
ncbi:chemotaxis protein MotB [Aliiroseovarius crassostreae]|uniref:Chemotaxis protein MotB n=1 Tax=Aliiroseovarius crassostreae TaxID=154981 RepID=A0A0P7KQS6_9RHOB|nr:flagellar motor protein MotB [Aliiroseovarius crassostreae]KPN64831.1 chemotaxis protein MotB [Aliiroseovarius crassostreae]SFU94043.1 chemotaxis protein MotB [Aliiroseovarius crassostreae]